MNTSEIPDRASDHPDHLEPHDVAVLLGEEAEAWERHIAQE